MAGQLIPAPELGSEPSGLESQRERIGVWIAWMKSVERFLLAGLRRKVGPDGDLDAAFREWYEREMEEHDRATIQMIENLNRRMKQDVD